MIVNRSLNAMAIFNNQLHTSMLLLTVKALPSIVILLITTASWNAMPKAQGEDAPVWQSLETKGKPHARHEAAFIQVKQRFYLLGGRGIKPVDVLDPATGAWTTGARPPLEIHHFQPVVWQNRILIAGAMTGPYPHETSLEGILIYDPEVDIFDTGTRKWSTLPSPEGDLPTPRAGCFNYVLNATLLVAGGESTTQKEAHNEVEAFDPETQTWHLASKLKQGRHGTGITMWQNNIYSCAGCAQRGGSPELNTTEYLPVKTR
jgi:hypothetical protein